MSAAELLGQLPTEPPSDDATRSGIKRALGGCDNTPNVVARVGPGMETVGQLAIGRNGPLVASRQVRLRDRDICVRSVAVVGRPTCAANTGAWDTQAGTTPPMQQTEAVQHIWPFLLQSEAGTGCMENQAGNRFGGSEICEACWQPHADANYVATDASGTSYCGDCWDTALGVTVVVRCRSHTGTHLCPCGNDLRRQQWFAVESVPSQKAHCEACCLDFWGLTAADMVVTAIEDTATRRTRAGGAHLPLSMATRPNDDTWPCISPLAGLSDRGF